MKFKIALAILIILVFSSFVIAENATSLNYDVVFEESFIPSGSIVKVETAYDIIEKPVSLFLGYAYNMTDGNESLLGYMEALSFNLDLFNLGLVEGKHTVIVSLYSEDKILDQKIVKIGVNATENSSEEEPAEEIIIEESLISTALDLIIDKFDAVVGDIINIQAVLKDEEQNPLPNKKINFHAGKYLGYSYTNKDGIAFMNWDTLGSHHGEHNIIIDFEGDNTYMMNYIDTKLVLQEGNSTIIGEIPMLSSTKVTEVKECIDIPYIIKEDVYEDCIEENIVTTCDESNTTCYNQTEYVNIKCFKEKRSVQKSKQKCKTKGLLVDDSVKLNIDGYVCNSGDSGNSVVVVCDSKYDGNGDGTCQSGESCMKFIINGKNVQKLEKNSRHDFIGVDDKYFVKRINVEVTQ